MNAPQRQGFFAAVVALLLLIPGTASADSASALLRQANAIQWSQLTDPQTVAHHLDLYVRAAQADPQNVEARVRAGEFAFYAWRLESETNRRLSIARTGLRLTREAVRLDPQNAAAWYWSGVSISIIGLTQGVLNSLQLIPEGRAAYERTIELDEGFRDGQAIANLARVYAIAPGFPMSIGNSRRAERMLVEGYESNPDSTYFPLFLADFRWSQGKTDEALALLEEVLEKKARPGDYTVLVNEINQRKAEQMRQHIQDGVERDRFNDVVSD